MSASGRQWRLAVCLSHPIHYRVPLMRRLAAHPQIERLKVFFYADTGLVARPDAYHGATAKWDVPLLDGYEYEFLVSQPRASAGRTLSVAPAVFGRIVRDSWDAVIIHSYTYPNDWLAWTACRLKGVAVLFYGEMYPINYRKQTGRLVRTIAPALKKTMVRGSGACLSIGSVARGVLLDLGVPAQRIFDAPYTVDNAFFTARAEALASRQTALRAGLGIPSNLPVVLCVAGMLPVKRQQDLIEAMARLDIPAQLVLVGGGPLLEEMRALCARRLPSAILAGFINQSAMPDYYAIADVFVLPSAAETFGLVVNEAMCFGLPIVASTGVAATKDLVQHGANGYVYAPGDVDALAACLTMLLADAERRQRFGERSREIIAGWSYDATVRGILGALEYVA